MDTAQVSVIIPVYNRGNVLRNTILSLNRQSYSRSRYQVIVVDDGSTDNTKELLQRYKFENFTFISSPINKGAGAARNIGIQAAEGDLIIFCDSDFILPSTFIESHVKEHENKENFAVSGMGHWHFIFSYDFKNLWAPFQREMLQEKYNQSLIQQRILNSPNQHLILEEEIYEENISPFIIQPNLQFINMFEEIISTHGSMLDKFQLPWITFCTGNVSIPKYCIESLGGFDEQFYPLGFDDWEFAYRFFLEGGKFCFSTNAEAYQQLTPASPKREQVAIQNYQKFVKKHPDLEVFLLSLDLKKGVPYTVLSKILEQHKYIEQMGSRYKILLDQFKYTLELFAWDKETHIQKKSKLTKNNKILKRYTELERNKKFREWLIYFNKLSYGFNS